MTKRSSGPSGRHSNPRRQLSQSVAAWHEQDRLAAREGKTWADWARERLQLGCLECVRLNWQCPSCRDGNQADPPAVVP